MMRSGRRTVPVLLAALWCGLSVVTPAVPARAGEGAAAVELTTFKAWLDSVRAGYGCDEGPARFRNQTVESAYPGRHFYYVLTYARGIPPPYQHPTTVVADLAGGQVRPIHPGSMEGYRIGLLKVSSAKDARLAAAAVMILATADPGERRWRYEPGAFKAKKSGGAWVCTFVHGSALYTSSVSFDKAGRLASFQSGAPPVP
jgi:hypothetical protein